ncbi:MAG: hypothetical protein ACT4NX_02110 [Deltaproteobacteria bacterium]
MKHLIIAKKQRFSKLQNGRFVSTLVSALSVFFLLSVSLHAHGYSPSGGVSLGAAHSHSSAKVSHSPDFCPVCRAGTKLRPADEASEFRIGLSANTQNYLVLDVLIPHLFLASEKPSRSPPSV